MSEKPGTVGYFMAAAYAVIITIVLVAILLTSCGAAPTWTLSFTTPTTFADSLCASTGEPIENLAFVEFFTVENGDTTFITSVPVDTLGGQTYSFEYTPPSGHGELLWLSRVWTLTGMHTTIECMSTGYVTPYDSRTPSAVDSLEVQ